MDQFLTTSDGSAIYSDGFGPLTYDELVYGYFNQFGPEALYKTSERLTWTTNDVISN